MRHDKDVPSQAALSVGFLLRAIKSIRKLRVINAKLIVMQALGI